MKKTKLIIAAAFAVATMFTSCVGPTGSQGPAGPTGATGNANVLQQVLTILPGNWVPDGTGGYYVTITAGNFDPTTSNYTLYWSSDNTTWFALPYVAYTLGGADINYYFTSTQINILMTPQTGAPALTSPTADYWVREVVIPPAVMKQHPGLNLNDYDAVMALIAEQNASKK